MIPKSNPVVGNQINYGRVNTMRTSQVQPNGLVIPKRTTSLPVPKRTSSLNDRTKPIPSKNQNENTQPLKFPTRTTSLKNGKVAAPLRPEAPNPANGFQQRMKIGDREVFFDNVKVGEGHDGAVYFGKIKGPNGWTDVAIKKYHGSVPAKLIQKEAYLNQKMGNLEYVSANEKIMVMKKLGDQSLKEYMLKELNKPGSHPLDVYEEIYPKAYKAIAEFQRKTGYLHTDPNLSNIVVGKDGNFHLIDYVAANPLRGKSNASFREFDTRLYQFAENANEGRGSETHSNYAHRTLFTRLNEIRKSAYPAKENPWKFNFFN
ncbi:hypothetical protein ROZALSC1DRAFT_27818 [Rozella allomycis CSF55]|uniref:Protein kinase domain-containing protein n=1 Tax=Rozella allomycis (strain CSF55) TaxID=988480 RepID=A0A4P9YM19_ROZAC|nr:hypothetical protein ROZALSC1DRAFT_27818 [Rozella allomycis CSF55]